MLANSSTTATITLSNSSLMIALTVVSIIVTIHWLFRKRFLESIVGKLPWWSISFGLAGMLYAIVTLPGEDRSFIYFQF